jgi:hypothetical protein
MQIKKIKYNRNPSSMYTIANAQNEFKIANPLRLAHVKNQRWECMES